MDADHGLPADLARETEALRRIARGVLFEPALAEDAVQEAWLAALRAPNASVTGGWLGESVKRIARGIRRRESRQTERERGGARRDVSESAAETIERLELLRALVGALEALDEPYRTAVRLRVVDDLPPRVIAERLALPVETVRTRVRRGLERMRAKLDRDHRGRRDALLGALVPFVGAKAVHAGLAAHAGLGVWGGVLVGTKLKWLAALALVACLGLWWRSAATRLSEPTQTAHETVAAVDASSTAAPGNAASVVSESANPSAVDARSTRALADDERTAWTISGSALLGRKTPLPHETVKLTIRRGYGDDGELLVERELVTNDLGVFEAPLDHPTCGVTVRVSGKKPDHIGGYDRRWVTPGESAPTGLTINYEPLDTTIRGRVLELDGAAIPDARVRGHGGDAKTDEHGAFELRTTSLSTPMMLEVASDAHLERQASVDVAKGGVIDGVEIRLERGARLAGRLVSEDGSPIAGAKITTTHSWITSTTSDADGRFAFANVPQHPDRYLVIAERDGARIAVLERDDPELPKEELLLVARPTRAIEGRVVDEHGAPIAAAVVTARILWSDGVEATSDDAGLFRFAALPRVKHGLAVAKAGFARTESTLPAETDGPIELVLDRGRTLSGTVVGDDGRPVAGAIVYARVDGWVSGEAWRRSGDDGSFALEHVPAGKHTEVDAHAEGWTRATLTVADDAPSIEIVLQRAAGLSGRVVDASTGQPIRRFRVAFVAPVLEPGEKRLSRYRGDWVAPGLEFDDDDGRWNTRRDALEPNCVTGLAVQAEGYGTRTLTHVETSQDPDAEPIVIELGRARVLFGRIVDKTSGRGIAGARLSCISKRAPFVQDDASGLPRAVADERGEFRLGDLPEEPVTLIVEADGFARRIEGTLEVPMGESRHDVELTAGATLRGTLFDVHDQPVAKQTVRLGTGGVDEVPFREWAATTDSAGAFEFSALPQGEYFLSQQIPDRGSWLPRITRYVLIEDEETLTVELRPPGRLTLRGELHANVPLPGNATIRAWRAQDRLDLACLADGARFELEGLAPGAWSVSAAWYDGDGSHDLVGQTQIEVGDRDPAPIVIELAPPRR
jgi:RNA polymerase sigma-70 factor (ECF subfamily)